MNIFLSYSKLQIKYKSLEKELDRYKSSDEFIRLNEKINKLTKRAINAESANIKLKIENKKIDTKNKKLILENNVQVNHSEELHNQILKKDKEIKSLKSIIKDDIKSEKKLLESIHDKSDIIKKLTKEIDSFKNDNEKLIKEVSRLKAQINKNSSNSGKPSSTNGFKKVVQNNRTKSNKKSGGQKGHKGVTLTPVANADVIIDHKVEVCTCGHTLENTEIKKKQEINLKIITEVTEHRYYEGFCPICKKVHKIEIPTHLNNPISYGNSVKSVATLLINQGIVSINRCSEFLNLVTNGLVNVSDGTIFNWNSDLSNHLKPVVANIQQNLLNTEILNVDETPIKINGKQMYIHNASNSEYTFQAPHKTKSMVAIDEIGLLPEYRGIIVSDHYIGYYNYGSDNAECNVHIARYLKNITEITNHEWALKFTDFLYEIKKKKEERINSNIGYFTDEEISKIFDKYDDIIKLGNGEYEASNHKEDDERRLLKRLNKFKENHLKFITNFEVPFSNNQAERDLRGVKTKQKIGKFRSFEGAEIFCTIKSVEQTSKKKDKNFFEVISDAFNKRVIEI